MMPNPTVFIIASAMIAATRVFAGPSGTPYSIGTPTAKEQHYVEMINRARANPTAEGIRLDGYKNTEPDIKSSYDYFAVNLTTMMAEFVTGSASGKPTLNVTPPLSINAALTTSARLHSQFQIDTDYQGHTGSGGSSLGTRITAQGYTWSNCGENVFASSKSVVFGHAGFNVDWGGADGTGMQGPPRGHRANIHSASFREIGVGNLTSAETTIPVSNINAKGPEVVTQDFATAQSAVPFITGVVYYDFNGNLFYDPGEGISGVEVGATGSTYKAVTGISGGYSIPVPGNATYPMTFWFPGASSATYSASATVSGLLNVKMDWKPAVSTPILTGPSGPVAGTASNYTCTTLPGATSYDLISAKVVASPATEGADTGNSGYTLTPGISGTLAVEAGGAAGNCFHFGHNGIASPTLLLTRQFVPSTGGSVSFRSKLTYATADEIALLQVRENGGNWTTLWSQAGSGGSGEASYNLRTQSLDAYMGKMIELRFVYEFSGGGYYSSGSGSGWYMDSISFSGTEELIGLTTTNSATSTLGFTPASVGNYRLWTRPRLADPLYKSTPLSAPLDVTAYPSGYAAWVGTQYPGVTGGATADHDGDGLRNDLEYAFGLNPTVSNNPGALPQMSITSSTISFSYTAPAGVTGVTYGAEWSNNLVNWNLMTDTGSGTTHIFTINTTGVPKIFIRHRITVTTP